MDFKWWICL